jgi:hypothetical protein
MGTEFMIHTNNSTKVLTTPVLITADSFQTPEVAVPTGFEKNLPWLAPAMNISSRLSDYFFKPTPIIISELPNRNGIGFPAAQLAKWNVDLHCRAFEGWRYCPMFEEHRSDDITTALGVVADVTMRRLKGFGNDDLWLVIALTAIDRTKNVSLAREYEEGEVNTVSMGAYVEGFYCSYCGTPDGKCSHIDLSQPVVFYELNGKLVYKMVYGVSPYELSIVRDPAYGIAIGADKIITYPNLVTYPRG